MDVIFSHHDNFSGAFKVGDLVTSIGLLWPWSRLFVADQVDLVRVGNYFSFKISEAV